jgi:hypothetical protein
MDRNKAIYQLLKNEQEVETKVNEIITKNLDKKKLILKLCWERERFSRSFFQKYQALETNQFLASNLLILRLMKDQSFSGQKSVTDEEAKAIVDGYQRLIESKETRFLIEQSLAEPLQLYDKIHALYNENYFPILSTYEDNDVWEQQKVDAKIAEYSVLLNLILSRKPKIEANYSPTGFIKQYYQTLTQFYCCFMRNELYEAVFGLLKKFSTAQISPRELLILVSSYDINKDTLYHTSISEFIKRAQKHLRLDAHKVKELLIFSEKNTQVFPLFLEINGRVYISHGTTYLIYILLHAITYKKLLDKETEKRSKEFEKQEVKQNFQNIGWTYLTNKIDKKKSSLEIDGITFFGRRLLIIECKGWTLKPFYEYKKLQTYILRDIKGIVDGKKYTADKPKKVPSLIEKIEFVKNNLSMFDLNKNDFDDINGLIVLRTFPPISEYKGINIISVRAITRKFGPTEEQQKRLEH